MGTGAVLGIMVESGQGVTLTFHLNSSCMSSRCGQGQLYFYREYGSKAPHIFSSKSDTDDWSASYSLPIIQRMVSLNVYHEYPSYAFTYIDFVDTMLCSYNFIVYTIVSKKQIIILSFRNTTSIENRVTRHPRQMG